MGQCQHLHLTGFLWGVTEYSTQLCACTREPYIFYSGGNDDDDLCYLQHPARASHNETPSTFLSPCDSPQTDHATRISQEAAMISENVVILDHSPWVLPHLCLWGNQAKSQHAKITKAYKKGKTYWVLQRHFMSSGESCVIMCQKSPLGIRILKSPLNSCDPSPCNSCSRGSLRISIEVSTWQVFQASQASSVELAKIQSCATFCLLKQLQLESLKPYNLDMHHKSIATETVGKNTTGYHEATVEYLH